MMCSSTDHYRIAPVKNPYRKGCVNSATLLPFIAATGVVIITQVFITLPYQMTRSYVETRKQRIEYTTQALLEPCKRKVNSTHSMHLYPGKKMQYDNETDYSFIYKTNNNNKIINNNNDKNNNNNNNNINNNKHSRDHDTCLVTATRCPYHYHILILITSDLRNFRRRQSIRETWGEDSISKKPKWKTFFLVGRTDDNKELHKLWIEMTKFEDIILGDNMENFYNLPPKLQMGFEWSLRYCSFDYLVKGDDDVFVNIPQLFAFVDHAETPKELLYAGNVHYAAVVGRDGRYGMTEQEYWKKVFPRYCSGGGFVLTRDVVEGFMSVVKSVPVIKIDDAYIGELALRAGVDVFHSDDFAMFESNRRCLYRHSYIVHHPVKTEDCMKSLYQRTVNAIIEMTRE